MTSVSFKSIFSGSDAWFRLLLAAVFLSAGIFRIFNPAAASLEMQLLGLPVALSWLVMVLEIITGISLLLNFKTRLISLVLVIFVLLSLIWAIIKDGSDILAGAGELFVFDLNPTDFFLHLIFLIILFFLANKSQEN